MKKITIKQQKGFTLIELVVVLAVFMMILDVAVSMFISMIQHQKIVLQDQQLLSQVSFVLDTMSDSLRTASVDNLGSCLVDDSGFSHQGDVYLLTHYNMEEGYYQGIAFISRDTRCREFFLDKDGILKESDNGAEPQAMLSDTFKIQYMRFMINGDKHLRLTARNLKVPRVTLSLKIGNQNQQNNTFQTTISNNHE